MTTASIVRNPYIVGPPITDPNRFFGREELFAFIEDNLRVEGNQVIVLHGQRRIGKSSVLKQIPNFIAPDEFAFILFDLQGKSQLSLAQVLQQLADFICRSLQLPESVKLPDISLLEHQTEYFANEFIPAVQNAIQPRKLVLLIDEFDVLNRSDIQGAAGQLFPYLQSLLRQYPDLTVIPVVGRQLNDLSNLLDLFKDAPNRRVGFLDRESGSNLVTQTGVGLIEYDTEAIQAILELSGCHPYFTQVICHAVFNQARAKKYFKVSRSEVKDILDDALEIGEGGLAWFHDGLTESEQFIFSAIIELQRNPCHLHLWSFLQEHKVAKTDEINLALERLIEWDLVQVAKLDWYGFGHKQSHRVTINLVCHWFLRKYSFHKKLEIYQQTTVNLTHSNYVLSHKFIGLSTTDLLSLVTTVIMTTVIISIRGLGLLQGMELAAYDNLMRLRPDRGPDDRLLVVEVTEADIQAQDPESRRGSSLSDPALAQLLTILQSHKPSVIGLNIYRDFPVQQEFPSLAQQLRDSENLIAICQFNNRFNFHPGIYPPPEVSQDRLGFSDVLLDRDGVLRRYLWFMTPDLNTPCPTEIAFSLKIVLDYLQQASIEPEVVGNTLKFADVEFPDLPANSWGYQMLLDYRTAGDVAHRVPLTEMLQGEFKSEWIEDKIVLIGVTAPSREDQFRTPLSQQPQDTMPGVMIQAQMVSQILGMVLDEKPLFGVWPTWANGLWIGMWAGLGSVVATALAKQKLRQKGWLNLSSLSLLAFLTVGWASLYLMCLSLLEQGFWVPLIPAGLSFTLASLFCWYGLRSVLLVRASEQNME
jgi:CHASE2 domain-containing sensor protein